MRTLRRFFSLKRAVRDVAKLPYLHQPLVVTNKGLRPVARTAWPSAWRGLLK